jgi:hypothetical protein
VQAVWNLYRSSTGLAQFDLQTTCATGGRIQSAAENCTHCMLQHRVTISMAFHDGCPNFWVNYYLRKLPTLR